MKEPGPLKISIKDPSRYPFSITMGLTALTAPQLNIHQHIRQLSLPHTTTIAAAYNTTETVTWRNGFFESSTVEWKDKDWDKNRHTDRQWVGVMSHSLWVGFIILYIQMKPWIWATKTKNYTSGLSAVAQNREASSSFLVCILLDGSQLAEERVHQFWKAIPPNKFYFCLPRSKSSGLWCCFQVK